MRNKAEFCYEQLDNTYSGPVVSITVDNTTIEATAYHPFWVIEGRDLQERSKPRELQEREDEGHSLPGRWVNSHELRAGDCIITRSGTRAFITEIRQRFDDAFPVSNLSIIGHHNYAVGDVGVLVHNKPVCDDAIAVAKKDLGASKSIDEIQDSLNQMVKNGKHTQKEADEALAKILDPNWKPSGTVATNSPASSVFSDTRATFTATRPKGTGYTYDVIQRTDVDWDRIRTGGDERALGMTNAQAAQRWGLAPELSDGNFATLHHLGQDARGPLAEASTRYHGVGKPGQDILHSQYERNQPHPTHQPDRKKFGVDTREYWRWRVANEYGRTR